MRFARFIYGMWKLSTQLLVVEKEILQKLPSVIVFGRPGAGKTTVANAAVEKLQTSNDNITCLGLDLDVCVPQWMRDNFANGIYPTLEERNRFANECCQYVTHELAQ